LRSAAKIERRPLVGGEIEQSGFRHPLRRLQGPDLFKRLQEAKMRSLVTEPAHDRLGVAHLALERLGVAVGDFLGLEHGDLARAIGERPEEKIHPDRGGVEALDGDDAGRQAPASATQV
jgi:hypothetical protein